jgi:hypothetical protein
MHGARSRLSRAALCLAIATTAGAARADGPADADSTARYDRTAGRLDLTVGAGYLGSPGAYGEAFWTGLRLMLHRRVALGLDLGYGLLDAPPIDEDRWWVIPSVAFVLPAGRVTFDFGGGVGVGTASGYTSWSGYFARPFDPTWALTAPAARAHAMIAYALSPQLSLFVRPEVAALLTTSRPQLTDTTWVGLVLGAQTRLL